MWRRIQRRMARTWAAWQLGVVAIIITGLSMICAALPFVLVAALLAGDDDVNFGLVAWGGIIWAPLGFALALQGMRETGGELEETAWLR